MKNDTHSNATNESISYALGVIETRLAEIARDFNQPEQKFREWVGILLLTQRQGANNRMSPLSGKTSKTNKTMEQMEVDEQPYRKTRRTDTSRKVSRPPKVANKKGFSYNGTHWTQQPKNAARVRKLSRERQAKLMAKRKAA